MSDSPNFPIGLKLKDPNQPSSLDLEPLTPQQQNYISYVAVGGLITEDDGSVHKLRLEDFATSLGVDRRTLNNWKRNIPNFWQLVEQRRSEIFTQNRITAVWNGLFLRAMKGDAEQAKIILGQYAKWQPPAQKHDITIGDGLADAALAARARRENAIEGEVVEPQKDVDNATH